MPEELKLNHPWLVAVWPGMGNVALNAGIYLLAKLGMETVAELDAGALFDVEAVLIEDGIIQPPRPPKNVFLTWRDPNQKHDLLVFLGEAQPPLGKYPLCRQLITYARTLGVQRVFTFAAIVTSMELGQRSRVFGAATDNESLQQLKRLELEILEDGHVSGLNGVLLGAAAERGLPGACLLGEMPHVFAEVPFPKASLAILEVFSALAKIDLDLTELAEQVRVNERQLEELLARMEEEEDEDEENEDEEDEDDEEDFGEAGEYAPEAEEEEGLRAADRQRIERLFEQASGDRSQAFKLKQELDRLGVFAEYEDRFLDLFKSAGGV